MSTLAPQEPPIAKLDSEHLDLPAQLLAKKIVIVDDIAINVKVAKAHLEAAGYAHFTCVTDSTEALDRIRDANPDLLLLDIMMPGVSGLEILETLRNEEATASLPILILTGAESRDLKINALELGATDFLMKPIDVEHLLPRVRNALMVKHYHDNLKQQVQQRTAELEQSQRELIHCLARAAEFRDYQTGAHVVRVGLYAGIIADELGIDPDTASLIGQAATLHDVGKIGIPDAILQKPGKLNSDEVAVMRRHCGLGKEVFKSVAAEPISTDHASVGAFIFDVGDSPTIKMARSIALTHHEKWDGSGYPLGLSGTDIPIEGRITAVADVFDALVNERPYKSAYSVNDSLAMMEEESGKHFDPAVLDAFFRRKKDVVAVQLEHADVV